MTYKFKLCIIIVAIINRPVGETVNSHAFHACIHGFESRTGHQKKIYINRSIYAYHKEKVPIAQLDRASDYGSEGWEFKSSWVRHGEVAQFGRAPGLGPGGRRFKSCLPHHAGVV